MADDWQAVAWEGVHLPLLAPTCLYEADAILIWFPYVTLPYPHYLDRRFNFISPPPSTGSFAPLRVVRRLLQIRQE